MEYPLLRDLSVHRLVVARTSAQDMWVDGLNSHSGVVDLQRSAVHGP